MQSIEANPKHAPVRAWFDRQGWVPQTFQMEVWDAFAQGQDGLLQAPTGSGKTYAAMGHVLSTAAASGSGTLGVKLIWVAPGVVLGSLWWVWGVFGRPDSVLRGF